jgi:hypothetical protein
MSYSGFNGQTRTYRWTHILLVPRPPMPRLHFKRQPPGKSREATQEIGARRNSREPHQLGKLFLGLFGFFMPSIK